MKIYFVANARMPSEKAHGIHIAKMCEAFIEEGADLTLVVPARGARRSVREFYHLRVDVPLRRLPTLDWYVWGSVGYRVGSGVFMLASLILLWAKRLSGEQFVIYTVDLDNFSSSQLAFVGAPLYSEMHGGKPSTFATRFLFGRARGIFAINSIIVGELKKTFPFSRAKYLAEPNGVDLADFAPVEKHHARATLGLPHDAKIVLYTGRFFGWKGLEIMPQAAALSPELHWQMVGGEKSEFIKLVDEVLPQNMFFAGSRPHSEMPLWLGAADVLLVLGTKRDTQSYRYTSPMKLFEYMTAGRAIVAADTPAIREVVSEREVFFYEPDHESSLAEQVRRAAAEPDSARAAALTQLAREHTWAARAGRILELVEHTV